MITNLRVELRLKLYSTHHAARPREEHHADAGPRLPAGPQPALPAPAGRLQHRRRGQVRRGHGAAGRPRQGGATAPAVRRHEDQINHACRIE